MYATIDYAQTGKEEIFRIKNVNGSTLTYDLRISVGGYNKPTHVWGASFRINDVSELVNDIGLHVDNCGFTEKISGTQTIVVNGGNVNYKNVPYTVATSIFAITSGQLVDNSTNYVLLNLVTQAFVISATNTANGAIAVASVVCTGGSLGAITDLRPAFNTTYEEIGTKVDKAGGLRDTFGANKTVVVDRTAGAEVVKNVVDITQFASTDIVRLRQTSWDYADITMGNLAATLDSTSHPLYTLTALTAPVAVDTFNTRTVGSYTAVNSPNLVSANPSAGSNSQGSGTFVFIPKKNFFLNSVTVGNTRNTGFTYTLTETVSWTTLFSAVQNSVTATDTLSNAFCRAGVSYTFTTNVNDTPYWGYTMNDTPDIDMVSYSGWYNSSVSFNYTQADCYTFWFANTSITTTEIATGTTVSSIQLNLRKNWTPASDVTVQLLDASNNVITWANATIAQTSITTSFATYTANLATPYSPAAWTVYKIRVSTGSTNTAHYYFIQWQQWLDYAAANSTSDTISNTLFVPYFNSTWIQQTVFVQAQNWSGRYAGLVLNNVVAGARAFARTSWYASISWLSENTTYYVNTDGSWSLTTSTASWIVVGKTYGPNLILKMP